MIPFPEYPRPALRRDSFLNLNGSWSYAITADEALPHAWDGEILVPYSPETAASGVRRTLQPNQWLHYQRMFTPPDGVGGRVLLHFGAVDNDCVILVNHREVGRHSGGYWPFSLDITDHLQDGENTLHVAVQDASDCGIQAHGKQKLTPGGMFYPAQSGIWQTVWLERVPENYIQSLTVTPDYDARTVTVKAHTSAPGGAANLWAVVRAGGVTIAEDWGSDEADQDGEVTLHIADEYFFPWSPDTPFLYDLTVGTTQGEEEQFDTVHSYFALRKWSCAPDEKGVLRFCLNDKPILLNGLLDQGYWPEGLLTAPAPESYADDILAMKRLGFNTLRKHIKVEPEEFYYQCDRLGMIVWQDMVNNGSYRYFRDTVLPTIGIQKWNDRRLHLDERSRNTFRQGAADAVNQLKNHPCICYWTIFNEGWGQFDSDRVCGWFRTLDATRFIDTTSGWFRGKNTDVDSRHQYFGKLRLTGDGLRPLVLSEFGGKTWRVEGHIFNPDKAYGYGACPTREALNEAVAALYRESIVPAVEKGLCAAIYTQVSDVEDEVNGLITYDRRVVKLDADTMLPISRALQDAMEKTVASFEKMG